MDRNFLLGTDCVIERISYAHLGVKACIYECHTTGMEERLAKGRGTLNAVSGLGIRNNGLTIFACCVISWCIVIPIATFGAKLWILDDKGLFHLESFQVFVGRQGLFLKSPKASAHFSLGWVHLELYVEIKKLLFLHSVLSHDVEDITKTMFIQRAKKYYDNVEICSMNQRRSMVYYGSLLGPLKKYFFIFIFFLRNPKI